jgi:ribonuclease BN (tRNA processing enzyme)
MIIFAKQDKYKENIMKITFIGSGSAFTRKNFQSNMLIESNGTNLMIDAGRTAPEALSAIGKTFHDIDALYLSHAHNDHVGSVEELAFLRYFVPLNKPKVKLYGNEKMLDDIWNQSLKGGLSSIQGKICTLDTFFDVTRVPLNDSFNFNNVIFWPVQTIHIMNGYSIVPSYGLFFTAHSGKKVFLTTDTQFAPSQIMHFYQQADIIFQDCETSKFKSGVHAHFDELESLPISIKNKMWLYHYQDDNDRKAYESGFAGFIEKGQSFNL